ncbi:MAG: hypothetical protein ABIJ09_06500 [Pseudomonadota bacterium]
MNESPASWIDIVSPVVTFIAVILVPVAVAGWVIFKTLTDKREQTAVATTAPGIDEAATPRPDADDTGAG